MDGVHPRRLPRLLRSFGLWAAGCTVLGVGCEQAAPMVRQDAPLAHAKPAPEHAIVQVAHHPDPEHAAPKQVPINLDTVLRLAEEQNAQIGVARARVDESLADNAVAARGWLPKVYAGIGYFRHEGGIQNEDGTLTHSSFGNLFPGVEICTEYDVREATYTRVNAERKIWQQKGELRKVTTETLVEAAETYFDLLTARRAEAVLRDLERNDDMLLKRAQDLQKDVGDILLEGVRSEISGRKQALTKLHQQGDGASAKLVYLLGLDPLTELVPLDEVPAPIEVVDASPEPAVLADRALTNGPGVRELQSLLAVIQEGMARLEGPRAFLPKVGLSVIEGGFGAGPGSRLDWDNRLDIGIRARWNLTEFLTARDQRRAADSRLAQVQLSYQDLRGKLALSVEEARSAIQSGREQIKLGEQQIRHANRTLELSKTRLTENVPGSSTTEVLTGMHGLELAHINYLQAIAAHNKAQIRLMLMLGPAACKP
jgi:outer membrane protein TolC